MIVSLDLSKLLTPPLELRILHLQILSPLQEVTFQSFNDRQLCLEPIFRCLALIGHRSLYLIGKVVWLYSRRRSR
jgi:hypothetical protein